MTKAITWIKDNYLLILVLCVAAILRFYHLDYQSVWLDELHTLNEANPSYTLSEVYKEVIAGEQMPPLYFFIINVLFKLFGYTPLVLRTFSAVVGVLGVLAMYFLGKEVHNRKAGLFAAGFACINFFHLYYSQEGRPYALLFLLSVVSYYFLLRFIKTPSVKSALLYGFFAGLMLYGHFFALFTLAGQGIVLLYYIYKPHGVTSKKFFSYCIISGIVIAVVFWPCVPIVLSLNQTTSFWIPPATTDTYLNIFKDFFAHSSYLIYAMLLLMIAYFALLAKKADDITIKFDRRKYRLGVFVFSTLIIITVLLPAIRSYLSVPMIISRYFMSMLPIVFIFAGVVLASLKNRIAISVVMIIIVGLTVKSLGFEKQYYTAISKSQFREVTHYIIQHNNLKSPIVTTLNWHYKYFFDAMPQQDIIGSTPDDYLAMMRQDTLLIKPFWYTNAHGNVFSVNEENKSFLEQKFDVQAKIAKYDAWASYYVPKGFYDKDTITNATVVKKFDLKFFRNITDTDGTGLFFHSMAKSFSPEIKLPKGTYMLRIKGMSYPAEPLEGESAHFSVLLNDNKIGDFYLNENGWPAIIVPFELNTDKNAIFSFEFDNDAFINEIDRNGKIQSIEILQN